MRIFEKTLLYCFFLAFSFQTLANNVNYNSISEAASKTNDLSRQALVTIFGEIVLDPLYVGQPTLIGTLFGLINGVLCSIALFWVLTVTLKHVVRAGHEGQLFGSGRSFVYPMMTFMGFMMLIPTASGWSISQLVMLWAASVMGVGSANLLTDKAADMMASGYSLVTQPTAPSTRSAARAIFEMNLCKYGINRELESQYAKWGPTSTPLMSTKGGQGDYVTGNGSAICGSAKTPDTGRSGTWNLLFDSKVDTASIVAAQRQALDMMQTSLDGAARDFVEAYLRWRDEGVNVFRDAETDIQHAAAAYEDTVNQALNQINYKDSLQSQMVSQIKSYGWASLGAWYHMFATANSKTNDVANATPITSGMSLVGEHGAGDLYNAVFRAYRSQLQNSNYTPPLGTQSEKNISKSYATDSGISKLTRQFNFRNLTGFIAQENFGSAPEFSNQVNPLIKMQRLGDATISVSEAALVSYSSAYATASIIDHSIIGKAGEFIQNPAGTAKDVLGFLSPVFYFLFLSIFAIGFSLSIYLPAIPFLYWMVGLFNWIVSVLVGCAAGPMWAATHLGAEEDKGSRSAYGYTFLIDMMLRPSLMVLGFFFASVSIIAGGTILNLLFASALNSANNDSLFGLVKMIGWLMIYARIATFSVTRIFGIQASLADYVITFLGGREFSGVMNGMVDNVKNMFSSAGSGSRSTPGIKDMPIRKNNSQTNSRDGIN